MPLVFQCQVCGEPFELAQSVLEKYPGWSPKHCRAHSTRQKAPRRAGRAGREENLTRSQVLNKYHAGPQDGLFTDGSTQPNPGPGGWGVVWVQAGEVLAERHGHEARTTNNRMELRALIEAYRLLPAGTLATVHTDSRLCVDTITKWAPGWERKGWQKKGGPIKNLELIQELLELYRARPGCSLKWVAAHSGLRWNEYADSLASAWMRDEV
jgi:ribonuclease HI